ncbi:MAG: prepilin peptidase [Planctomycetota bacterium]|nr:prepilin peptidase [Planctomycetota bacterium]
MKTLTYLIVWHPWFLAFWAFGTGAIFGSFLNVVIYRLPRGMSLSVPGSHCPRCQHAIRWYHNLPIVGWIMLRGRCYDCGNRISVRYPLVELAVALLFGTCWFLITATIPFKIGGGSGGPLPAINYWPAIGWIAVSLFAGCGVLASALICFDRQQVPLKLFVPTLAATLFLIVVPRNGDPGIWWCGVAGTIVVIAAKIISILIARSAATRQR